MTVKTQQIYHILLFQGYVFRLLRVIIRPSNEPTQDYLIPSGLWDPVALTVGVAMRRKHHPKFVHPYWNNSAMPLQCNQADRHHHIQFPGKIRKLLVSRK